MGRDPGVFLYNYIMFVTCFLISEEYMKYQTYSTSFNPPESSWMFWWIDIWHEHGLLLAPPMLWVFFLDHSEGASHFYSSWRELWDRRHLFASDWWKQLSLSVAVRLLCSGAGASHLPSGYSGHLHEVFRWCPWCQRGTLCILES